MAVSNPQEVERTKYHVNKMGYRRSPPVAGPKPSFLVRLGKKTSNVTRGIIIIALGWRWSFAVLVFSNVLGQHGVEVIILSFLLIFIVAIMNIGTIIRTPHAQRVVHRNE